MKKTYLLLITVLFSVITNAQSSANYIFTTNNNGSLGQDKNSNAIDMSTGTTTLLIASTDDARSGLTNIGFDFWFMGSRSANFSCTDNGIIELGGNSVSISAYLISANTTLKLLAPFANDLEVGTDGKVHYKLFGSAPTRVLVIEYNNIMIRYLNPAAAGTATWQVRLYESDGTIEYIYDAMATNAASQAGVNVGFGINTTNNSFVTVNATNTSNTTGAFAAFTPIANSTVAHLHSASEGTRRYYRFTPTTTTAPSGLSFSSVNASGMTLNWTDNSSDEVGFAIYRSTDGVNYSFVTLTAANAVSSVQAGLAPSTNYFWNVYAVREIPSSVLSGSQATTAVLPINLLTFSGYKESNHNVLRWTTVSESNNRGFEIQRSTDGVNFGVIGFMNSQVPGGNSTGNLNYTFIDNNPAGAKKYYRLRQVDIDNHAKYSNIVLIRGDKPLTLTIGGLFPNPANHILNVVIDAPVRNEITLVITDMAGKIVKQQPANVETGSNTITMNISNLANGTYTVKAVCKTSCESVVSSFIKQ